MSVNSMASMLTSQIETALNMDVAAQQSPISNIIAAAVGSMAGVGKIPSAPSPIPVVPAGVSAGAAQIEMALSMGPAAQQSVVAQLIAAGISSIGVNAPPAGLSFLAAQIEMALSMGPAANQSTAAQIIGNAVPAYYNMGTVI